MAGKELKVFMGTALRGKDRARLAVKAGLPLREFNRVVDGASLESETVSAVRKVAQALGLPLVDVFQEYLREDDPVTVSVPVQWLRKAG